MTTPKLTRDPSQPKATLFGGLLHSDSLHSELDIELEQSVETRSLLLDENPVPENGAPPPTIRQTKWRWFALALVCLVNFALYYCYNNPQALQPAIEEVFQVEDADFNLLYSVYSLPNIILPFFGGYLIDTLGVRTAINLFGFVLIVGQGIFTFGAYQGSFNMMVFGRFVFGLGGENLAVSQLPMVNKWFSITEISFAWAFGRAAIRIGSSLNSFFTPKIYLWTGAIYGPLLVGLIITVVSWISGLVLSYMDRYADNQEIKQVDPSPKINFSDLKTFPMLFFLLLLNYPLLYGSFFGLSNNINNLIVTRYGFNMNQVGNLIMIIYLVAALIGPFFGPMLDRYGKRIRVMFFAAIVFLISEFMFAFLDDRSVDNPNYRVIFPLFGISIFYSVYSIVFWPCLALIVNKRLLGTATGIATAVLNLMLTLFPLALGFIHDNTMSSHQGYFWTEITICVMILLGILTTIWIYYVDSKSGRLLDKAPKERREEVKAEVLKIDEDK